jgi:glycosyltransferase involved in cell wall biosynthesis
LRVLFVTYRFPPQASVGVLRPLKFAKYLTRLGVHVTVLTIEPAPGKKQDSSLLEDLPSEVSVVAVREEQLLPALQAGGLRRSLSVLHRWAVLQKSVPDLSAGFIRPALHASSHFTIDEFDVVLASGPPWSGFVVAEKISHDLELPFVLDYRDPWTTAFPKQLPRKMGLCARWLNPRLERSIVSRARAIVSVHDKFPPILASGLELPTITEKCHWIPNGYDPEDFESLFQPEPNRFIITYAGSLHGTRTLRPVLDVLDRLLQTGVLNREQLRLRILGPAPARVKKELEGSTLDDIVEAPGFVPHRQALAYLMSSTVNLSLEISYGGPEEHIPAKVYEYLRAGRPILAISKDGLTPALIKRARAGWSVSPDDRDGLRKIITNVHAEWQLGRDLPRPDPQVVARFDRAHLTQELAKILQGCITG